MEATRRLAHANEGGALRILLKQHAGQLCDPEVRQLEALRAVQQQVGRLHVPVHDPCQAQWYTTLIFRAHCTLTATHRVVTCLQACKERSRNETDRYNYQNISSNMVSAGFHQIM